MEKVVKLYLICKQTDSNGNEINYINVNKILWDLQSQTRTIKNKTVQLCWEYSNFSSDYYKKLGTYPDNNEILGYKGIDGYVNSRLSKEYILYSGNLSMTSRNVCKDFKNAKKDIIFGKKSILYYKDNQPLDIHNKCIALKIEKDNFYVELSLLNKIGKEMYNFSSSKFNFKIVVKDKSTRTILERCIDGIYGVGASKLIYSKKKNCWVLNLVYKIKKISIENTDNKSNLILGVDLGIHYPICASVYGSLKRFIIEGGEIKKFAERVNARKISLLKQGKYCGNGRIGHGIKTRNKPVYKIDDKIARFRDTVNHKYSKALIEYAIKNNCGII